MAPLPIYWDGFSNIDGGRKDEPDLLLGNNRFISLDDVWLDPFTDKDIQENHRIILKEKIRRTMGELVFGGLQNIIAVGDIFDFEEIKAFVNVLNERGVLPGFNFNRGYHDLGKRWAKHYDADSHFARRQISGNMATQVGIKYICMMSMGDGGNHQSGADLVTNYKPEFILDTASEVNITGDKNIFVPVLYNPEGFDLRAANGSGMASYICGRLSHERYHINYVYFSEDVGPRTIISGPDLDLLGYSLKFEGGMCEVRDNGILVGKGCLVEKKKYPMDYLKIPLDRVPVQVPNVENVPLPDGPVGPLSVLTPVWTAIRTLLLRFSGSLFKQASEEAPRRPPV